MRNRSPANRPASSPPAPPRTSTITFLSSLGSGSTMARRISSSSSASRASAVVEHLAHVLVVRALAQQLARAGGVVGGAPPLLGELMRGLECGAPVSA